MKQILGFTICLSVLLAIAVVPAFCGEVIDGIVATVNRQPLLRSDWDEAVCFEARQLLKAQMGNANYMQPSDDELRQDIAKLRSQVPNGNDDESWRKLLAIYGLSEEVVKRHLRAEFQVMNFVEVRLRPNIHVQGDEVEAYYQNQLLPDLQKSGGKVVALDEVEPRIRELLTQQRMDELLDAWLHNLRQQAEIHSSVSIPGVNAPTDSARAAGGN